MVSQRPGEESVHETKEFSNQPIQVNSGQLPNIPSNSEYNEALLEGLRMSSNIVGVSKEQR